MFITLAAAAEPEQLEAKVAKVAAAKGHQILVVIQPEPVGKEIQAAALEAEARFLVDQV
jgi:uncharacterized membrane protein YgcG